MLQNYQAATDPESRHTDHRPPGVPPFFRLYVLVVQVKAKSCPASWTCGPEHRPLAYRYHEKRNLFQSNAQEFQQNRSAIPFPSVCRPYVHRGRRPARASAGHRRAAGRTTDAGRKPLDFPAGIGSAGPGSCPSDHPASLSDGPTRTARPAGDLVPGTALVYSGRRCVGYPTDPAAAGWYLRRLPHRIRTGHGGWAGGEVSGHPVFRGLRNR